VCVCPNDLRFIVFLTELFRVHILHEAVSIPNQDRKEFYSLLKLALAIDPDERPEWRLANLIYQRRARWLMDREEDLFLETVNGN